MTQLKYHLLAILVFVIAKHLAEFLQSGSIFGYFSSNIVINRNIVTLFGLKDLVRKISVFWICSETGELAFTQLPLSIENCDEIVYNSLKETLWSSIIASCCLKGRV